MIRVSLLALASMCLVEQASAVNVAFMPGDAFFSSRLTAEVANGASTERPLVLNYARDVSPAEGGFCGYAGFEKLQITNLSVQMAEALRNVYNNLRKHRPKELRVYVDDTGKETIDETNGFVMLVYPKQVDWNRQKVGLKYNEHWMNLTDEAMEGDRISAAGEKWKAERYVPFLLTADAVAEDWQHAATFERLPVQVPARSGYGVIGNRLEVACSIRADQIQLVILDSDDLEYYFKRQGLGDGFRINAETTYYSIYFPSDNAAATDEDDLVEIEEWPHGLKALPSKTVGE